MPLAAGARGKLLERGGGVLLSVEGLSGVRPGSHLPAPRGPLSGTEPHCHAPPHRRDFWETGSRCPLLQERG